MCGAFEMGGIEIPTDGFRALPGHPRGLLGRSLMSFGYFMRSGREAGSPGAGGVTPLPNSTLLDVTVRTDTKGVSLLKFCWFVFLVMAVVIALPSMLVMFLEVLKWLFYFFGGV